MPDNRRIAASNVNPGGGGGVNVYVSGASPPVAAGNVSGSIVVPTRYRSAGTVSVNVGLRPSATARVNVRRTKSPSASAAAQV